MRIGVIGAGAIGCVLGGYLAEAGEDVFVFRRSETDPDTRALTFGIEGVRGTREFSLPLLPAGGPPPEAVLLATKTQDLPAALQHAEAHLGAATVVPLQNGIRASELSAAFVPPERIVAGIVLFGATYLRPGSVVHNFEGEVVLGAPFGARPGRVEAVAAILAKAFSVRISDDIRGAHWTKLLLNLNNALCALTGRPVQETFRSLEVSRIGVDLIREAVGAFDQAGIRLAPLPGFDEPRLRGLLSLPPGESARVFSGIMVNLSASDLHGSVLQSLLRDRKSEIEYLNGEIAALGREHGFATPLHERTVGLVHRVEAGEGFFSVERLLAEFEALSAEGDGPR